MEYLDVVMLAEADSGLKELDYCPSRSDADCDYTWPPEPVPGAPGWSYVKFFYFSTPGIFFGIRTAADSDVSEWKWIDP
jgi:hypothetical protein